MRTKPSATKNILLRDWWQAGSIVALLSVLLAGCIATNAPAATTPRPAATAPESTRQPVTEPAATLAETAPPSPTALPAATALPTATPLALGEAPASTAYTLPLVAQHVTETSAVLTFELATPAEGWLLYGAAGEPLGTHSVALEPGQQHQVVLEGLSPGTEYAAAVGLGADSGTLQPPPFNGQAWGPIRFATASEVADGPLRVGVFGDSGFGDDATYQLAAEMAEHDLDFTLHTGDLVYKIDDNDSPYEAYALKWYLPLAPILQQMPVYPVVGNHDVEAAAMWQGEGFYYHVFPPFPDPAFAPSAYEGRNQWYALARNGIQFLMLDTQVFFNEPGRAEHEAWLAERLADDRFRATIAVMHVPPYNYGLHAETGPTIRGWSAMFEQANVPLVLSGHDHNYQRLAVNGVTYIISGGGSATLYDQQEEMPEGGVYVREVHFVLLTFHEDRIDVQAIGRTGEVLDETTVPLS